MSNNDLTDNPSMFLNLKTDLQQLRAFAQQLKLNKSVELINEHLQSLETQISSEEIKETNQLIAQSLSDSKPTFLLQATIKRILISGVEILQALQIQINARQLQPDQFEQKYEESIAKLSLLQDQQTKELEKITQVVQQIKNQIQPQLNQFEIKLSLKIKQIIDSADITVSELKKTQKLTQKLNAQITDELQKMTKLFLVHIQDEVQEHLRKEVERLQAFSDMVIQKRQSIDFFSLKNSKNSKQDYKDYIGQGIGLTASYLTKFGGIWPNYQMAGVKGAAFGAVSGMGTVISANLVLKIIAFPLTWQVSLAVSLLSSFTSGWLTGKLFGADRIAKFKADYKAKMLAEIDKQLKSTLLSKQINDYIDEIFEMLKQQVHQETEAWLDNTQNTLAQLQNKRNETFNEIEELELKQIHLETQRIISNAQQLNVQD